MDIKLNRDDKKALHQALWDIYQSANSEDWETLDKIKDENLKIIKRILYSLPRYLEYEENGEEFDYIPSDYSSSMKNIILYPKSLPAAYDWLEKAIKNKNREAIFIAVPSIFYMTYML